MSLDIGTVFQVVELVQKAVEIYQRVRDAPEAVRKLGQRMERLETILASLEMHLRSRSKHALVLLREGAGGQADTLLDIIKATRGDCEKVYGLFDRWENKVGPLGLEFRDNAMGKVAARAYFALGSSAKELEGLSEDIERHRRDIDEFLGIMGVQGLQANHNLLHDIKAQVRELHAAVLLVKNAANPPAPGLQPPSVPAGNSQLQNPGAAGRKPSPSPSRPTRQLKIIFVDPHNIGRSVCAEALTKLYGQLTVSTGGTWRIPVIHSAGFFVKSRSNVTELVENLDYKYQSYKLGFGEGGKSPVPIAAAAVFDNKSFGRIAPFKRALHDHMKVRTSRGLRKDLFRTYDYIIVFTGREHDNMLKLRAAIAAADPGAAKGADRFKNMGRVVHLGRFIRQDGAIREIVDPPKNSEGKHDRARWNQKVADLKLAIRRFLQKEVGWVPPEPQTWALGI